MRLGQTSFGLVREVMRETRPLSRICTASANSLGKNRVIKKSPQIKFVSNAGWQTSSRESNRSNMAMENPNVYTFSLGTSSRHAKMFQLGLDCKNSHQLRITLSSGGV